MKLSFKLLFGFLLISSIAIGQKSNDWIVQFENQIPTYKKTTDLVPLSKHLFIYQYISEDSISERMVRKSMSFFGKIKFIFPNAKVQSRMLTPNDDLYDEQWNMDIIEASNVWEETTGGSLIDGREIVVAVLDDGIDVTHPDFANNIWSNPNEISGDGIDNDDNGYIDDSQGLNIQEGNDLHPLIDHGTKVAGIIAAKGNNSIGIAGINWNVKVLFLSNVSNVAEIITAYDYVYDLKDRYIKSNGSDGANIVVSNFSAGIKRVFPSDFPSWCQAYDLLGSVGILSVGSTANEDFNLELEGDMPTLCNSDYLIMVTNTNRNDQKVFDTADSKINVDIGAPGENISSLDINNQYGTLSGTSASAPHVSGAVALLYSIPCLGLAEMQKNDPSSSALLIKNALLGGVDLNESLNETVSGGRLNIYSTMLQLSNVCGESTIGDLEVRSVRSNQNGLGLTIDYNTNVFSDHKLFIYDLQGRKVYSSVFNPNVFDEKTINVDKLELSSSLYVLSISDNNNIASKLFYFPPQR